MAGRKLYLNRDAEYDWLIALEFGAVDDTLPNEQRRIISDSFSYVLDRPEGEPIGFSILDFSKFDPEDSAHGEIWNPPEFDAPALGLHDATAGEIAVAGRAFFEDRDSLNRWYFGQATNSTGEEAAHYWRLCLETGDSMAHYGIGYTLLKLGRAREALHHLRAYSELAPSNTWVWYWLGKAQAAVGETEEARRSYERALALEKAGGEETDAADLLNSLENSRPSHRASEPRPLFYESDLEWPSYSEEQKVQILFETPDWNRDRYLSQETNEESERLLMLVERRWKGLTEDEMVDLLIKGPSWMREGVLGRSDPDERERLEELANQRWNKPSEDEKLDVLSEVPFFAFDEILVREQDQNARSRLSELARERQRQKLQRDIEQWKKEHPGREYSTTAHHARGPSSGIIRNYYEGYNENDPLTCAVCGWEGRVKEGGKALTADLFRIHCPRCNEVLLLVSLPTVEQVREAARKGNREARADLRRLELDDS